MDNSIGELVKRLTAELIVALQDGTESVVAKRALAVFASHRLTVMVSKTPKPVVLPNGTAYVLCVIRNQRVESPPKGCVNTNQEDLIAFLEYADTISMLMDDTTAWVFPGTGTRFEVGPANEYDGSWSYLVYDAIVVDVNGRCRSTKTSLGVRERTTEGRYLAVYRQE